MIAVLFLGNVPVPMLDDAVRGSGRGAFADCCGFTGCVTIDCGRGIGCGLGCCCCGCVGSGGCCRVSDIIGGLDKMSMGVRLLRLSRPDPRTRPPESRIHSANFRDDFLFSYGPFQSNCKSILGCY